MLAGFGAMARQIEEAEAAAMERALAVAGEDGAFEVRDRLHGHRAEKLRPFLELLRDDRPVRSNQ